MKGSLIATTLRPPVGRGLKNVTFETKNENAIAWNVIAVRFTFLHGSSEDQSADPAESVDADFDCGQTGRESGDSGQNLAFEKLQRRSATSRAKA